MAARARSSARRPAPQRQPVQAPSEDVQFLAFIGFTILMIALLGACGAF